MLKDIILYPFFMPKNLPNSLKKFIRKEKAKIRREFSDAEKQKELIKKLHETYENKRNIQPGDNPGN